MQLPLLVGAIARLITKSKEKLVPIGVGVSILYAVLAVPLALFGYTILGLPKLAGLALVALPIVAFIASGALFAFGVVIVHVIERFAR